MDKISLILSLKTSKVFEVPSDINKELKFYNDSLDFKLTSLPI